MMAGYKAYDLKKCARCQSMGYGEISVITPGIEGWDTNIYCSRHYWQVSKYLDQVDEKFLIKPPAVIGESETGGTKIIQQSLF